VHADLLTTDASFAAELRALQQVHAAATARLTDAVHKSLCLVDLARDTPLL
jgi:hypothetical protein